MQFLMLVRVDPALAAATTEDRGEPTAWIAEGVERGLRVQGDPVQEPGTAVVVRVRNGRTLLADGPAVAQPEPVTGYDLLEAPDLETAVDYASRHPAAAFGVVEVREVRDDFLVPGAEGLRQQETVNGPEYLFLHLPALDGGTPPTEPEPELVGWIRDVEARGATLGGARLRDATPERAAVVRRRHGEVLVARGPYTELAEQIAGVDLIRAADRDSAVTIAAAHPTAGFGAIEVRPLALG